MGPILEYFVYCIRLLIVHLIQTTFTQTTVEFHKYIGIYHFYLTALILFLIEFMFYQTFASSLKDGINYASFFLFNILDFP